MKYRVQANFLPDKAADFYRILTDGTVQNQKPDGAEIVASMKRAIITKTNHVEWYEQCFCATPLAHERRTVYDKYFANLSTQRVDEFGDLDGDSFWPYLAAAAGSPPQ